MSLTFNSLSNDNPVVAITLKKVEKMQDGNNVKYETMVAALIKDGNLIKESLTPEDCHILHMAVGVAGEGGELLECFLNAGLYSGSTGVFLERFDRENCTEELGDLEFYLEGLSVATNAPLNFEAHAEVCDPLRLAAHVLVYSAKVLDAVKKAVIYRKELETTDFIAQLTNLTAHMASVYAMTKISREESRKANIGKLLTGEKARYKLGAYTDKQAQGRTDKDGKQG